MKCQVGWITSWNQDCQVKYQQSQICRWYHSNGRNRLGRNGQTLNKVTDFIFLGSKITEDGDCSHEIKRHLLLGRNAMTNLDNVVKHSTLLTKVCIVRAIGFPVVMYGCESWATKMAECQRIDAFELWCWRRLLRVLWTARRLSQSVLKEIDPYYSLGGLMLRL